MVNVVGLTGVAGFDAALMEELPSAVRVRLGLLALLRGVAFILLSGSAGVASFVSLGGGWQGLIGALAIFVGFWLLLWSIGRLLISAGGPAIVSDPKLSSSWRPGVLWPCVLFFAGIIAAQPILLALGWSASQQHIVGRINNLIALNFSRQRDVLLAGDNQLRLQRAQLLERLAGGSSRAVSTGKRRKALLVGSQDYIYASKLSNPQKDVHDLEKKLQSMGFDVSTSVDEVGETIQLRILKYIESLQPGDVSVVYYSGHGYQQDGHNYIVPKDFDGKRVAGIRVTRILEAIDRRSPQLQVILLDACRVFDVEGFKASTGGLAELQGGTNSFVAMAAQPGQVAYDGKPGTNGLFTAAILRHIDQPEDIGPVFRRIAADVAESARKMGNVQQPVITSTLNEDYVQLIDPALKSPVMAAEFAGETDRQGGDGRVAANRTPSVCAARPGISLEQQKTTARSCLIHRIEMIDVTLKDWRLAGAAALKDNAESYGKALARSGLFTERIYDMWRSSSLWCGIVTALVLLLVMLGELWAWVYQSDLKNYFLLRNQRAVQRLEHSHQRSEDAVERLLAGSRHSSYRHLERFRTSFDWKGCVDNPPSWSIVWPEPDVTQLQLIDGWLSRNRVEGGAVP